MISVIVPHHKETVEQMKPLLMSLETQQGIDFNNIELIIVNDDKESEVKQDDLKAYANVYPRTRIFFNDKAGYMGISRQIGIDNAQGEYAVFCDADDMLYSATILYDLLTRREADVYSFQFVEELENHQWIIHEQQFVWMFAKSYRIQFLREHDIRFSENIMWHEDTYFNQVLLAYNPTIETLGYIGYLWKYSPNSITRKNNGEYTSKSMCMYIDALDERLSRIKYVLTEPQRTEYCINDIVFMYCTLQDFRQPDVLDTVRKPIEKRLTEYIKKNDPNLNCITTQYIPMISRKIQHSMQSMMLVPREGFWEFIQRIMGVAA